MSAGKSTPFGGTIGKTVAGSKPWWPQPVKPPPGAPNILVVLFDDVGFSDFGCYGSPIKTPTIDTLAAAGLRYSGFHTTAMCSTTRAALLTGRNHHSVGVGCLANFDCGYPGYRGKIAKRGGDAGGDAAAARLSQLHGRQMARHAADREWRHRAVRRLAARPRLRPLLRLPRCRDRSIRAGADVATIRTSIRPAHIESGYHLTADLVDQSIRFIADHIADRPDLPWLTWVALGACHAPHQAPRDIIMSYDDDIRAWLGRRARAADGAAEGDGAGAAGNEAAAAQRRREGVGRALADEQRVFTRLQAAFAGMLDHADRHLARLIAFLDKAGIRDNTLVIVMSDNGASQEGGPLGFINAMGPYNFRPEPMAEKLRRIDDIGGPDTHTNFPHGWAMASNTPLRRYKQNTHGGGIRDPFVMSWPKAIKAKGEMRHQFVHACDLTPTLLESVGIKSPENDRRRCRRCRSKAKALRARSRSRSAASKKSPQYFEMFGHRGIWHDGWKAVAFHPSGTPFENDKWELFHLDRDFSEADDLAEKEPERLEAMIKLWWSEAEAHKVLPLDDRFGPRFAENAARFHGARTSSPFTPAWAMCRPTSRPTCAAAATRSRPHVARSTAAPRAC